MIQNLNELKGFKYCGHSALMGKEKREWQDVEYVLGFFDRNINEARKKYRIYVEQGAE